MQEVKNYGSFLQAWSLKHVIEGLGHTCDFINIVPGVQLEEYKFGKFDNVKKFVSRICGWDFVKRIRTIFRFHGRFSKEFLPELGVKVGESNASHYDTVVIGSDEVFNCAQKSWFGYSKQLFGAGLNADKVISYAGSFGKTDAEILSRLGISEEISQLLRKMDKISVRDEKSVETVKKLTGIFPEENVDPVLIYNYDHLMPKHIAEKDYMLVYTYPGRIKSESEISAIKEYARNKNLKLISVGHYFSWCDDVIVPHPFEVLAYFKYADCIVTDTFHGSLISIKYSKPFVAFVRDMNSNKLTYLLTKFLKTHHIVANLKDFAQIMDSVRNEDDTETQKIIFEETQKSLDYLKNNLSVNN